MYIARIPNRSSPPAYLLRESYREGGKVKNRTLANLSALPIGQIKLMRRVLKGETLVSPHEAFSIGRSLPHGHVEIVLGVIRKLGLDRMIGSRRSRQRDLVVAMIVQRLLFPCSKLATTRHWHSTTLAEELAVADADEDELYDALDWLLERQASIEQKLARKHLPEGSLVLYDVSSSYYEGRTCPLARYGHDRDGKGDRPIIVYGVLTDSEGRPVAVEVYPGNTGDPTTVADQVTKLRQRFGLSRVILVGDRGMLTQTQIDTLKEHPELGWISALRSGSIRALMASGDLQRSLFDETLLAYYVQWHLKQAWAPLLFEDEQLPADRATRDPVAPAEPSASAKRKKATHRTADDLPVHSFATLIAELATRCRHTCVPAGGSAEATFTKLTDPTPLQTEAFRLLGLKPAGH